MFSPIVILRLAPTLFLAAHPHTFSFSLSSTTIRAVLALVAGVLVLIRPKNLNLIVAGYLIVLGVVELFQFSF